MEIPTNVKNAISSTFYDKVFTRYNVTQEEDDEGEIIDELVVANGTFKGNPHFNNFEWLQKKFGIEVDIDMSVSTHSNEAAGTIISYDGQLYEVYKALPYDSHYFLVCREWSSKSSTLTSV